MLLNPKTYEGYLAEFEKKWKTLRLILFPDINIFSRPLTFRQQTVFWLFLLVCFSVLGAFFPADGFIGFDWVNFFSGGFRGGVVGFYPPWGTYLVRWLSWPILIGLTLASVSLAIIQRAQNPVSALLAFFTLPLFWVLFLGQLEGITVLGLLGLPWLAPLALIKPVVSIFAAGARPSYLVGVGVTLVVSLLIWGLWPLGTLQALSYYSDGQYPQDIALKWWGVPIACVLLWFSRGDMDMLMLAGCFGVPHLIPYNLLPVVPAIARLKPRSAGIASGLSWLSLSANWLGPYGWWLGWLFVAWLWGELAMQRYSPSAKRL